MSSYCTRRIFNGHTQSKSGPLIFLHRLFQNCAWKYDEANMQTLMCPGCQHNTRAQQTDNSSPLHMRSKWVRTMQHRSYQVIARDHCDQVTDWLIMYPITPILNFSLTLYHKGWPLCTSLCNSFLQQPQDYNFTTDYWHGSKFVPNISLIFFRKLPDIPLKFSHSTTVPGITGFADEAIILCTTTFIQACLGRKVYLPKNVKLSPQNFCHVGNHNLNTEANKQPMGCEAQLAWKCLFTPSFIDWRFGPGK